jgi:3-oxoacyl-[acyl-carrier-protein] synthase-3
VTDYTDRSTCILFGDGAGAAVIGCDDEPFCWTSQIEGGDEVLSVDRYMHMNGQAVYRFATKALAANIQTALNKAGASPQDVDCYICHQANERIIRAAADRLGEPLEKFFLNIAERGNTSAASVAMALDDACHAGKLKTGSKVVLAGFGGGLSAGAIYTVIS